MRQTVAGLIGWPRLAVARRARSAVDRRLSGSAVRWTASQASALTTARSSGGKSDGSAAAGSVVEHEVAPGPALPPTANRIGMELHFLPGGHVGERGMLVQQQDQCGALPQRV